VLLGDGGLLLCGGGVLFLVSSRSVSCYSYLTNVLCVCVLTVTCIEVSSGVPAISDAPRCIAVYGTV
jgi:hypothetical protein